MMLLLYYYYFYLSSVSLVSCRVYPLFVFVLFVVYAMMLSCIVICYLCFWLVCIIINAYTLLWFGYGIFMLIMVFFVFVFCGW